MILILSKEDSEFSTEQVIDWLDYFGAAYYRLNGASFYKDLHFENNTFSFQDFDIDSVNVVWNRRWLDESFVLDAIEYADLDYRNVTELYRNLTNELKFSFKYFVRKLSKKKWLSGPNELAVFKLLQLEKASEVGLKTPETIITTNKKELEKFIRKHKRVISKPISEPATFLKEQDSLVELFGVRTIEVEANLLDEIEDNFFPSLFQQLVEKAFEIRTFYLDREFYSMAIFSQLDPQTSIDFRNYNRVKPNRTEPVKLPKDIEHKLQVLIDNIGYTTGSIDLVYTENKEFVFLEFNPVGQFGMTSYPCNYGLEKKVAKYLIKLDHGGK